MKPSHSYPVRPNRNTYKVLASSIRIKIQEALIAFKTVQEGSSRFLKIEEVLKGFKKVLMVEKGTGMFKKVVEFSKRFLEV